MNKDQVIDFLMNQVASEIAGKIKDLNVFRAKLESLYYVHEEILQSFRFKGNLHDLNSDIAKCWMMSLIAHMVKTSIIYDKEKLPKK